MGFVCVDANSIRPVWKIRFLVTRIRSPGNVNEIQDMFGLNELKQTRVYQEGVEEGDRLCKIKMIPLLIRLGLSEEQAA